MIIFHDSLLVFKHMIIVILEYIQYLCSVAAFWTPNARISCSARPNWGEHTFLNILVLRTFDFVPSLTTIYAVAYFSSVNLWYIRAFQVR